MSLTMRNEETWILMLLVRKCFEPLTWLNSTNLTVDIETCKYVMFWLCNQREYKKAAKRKTEGRTAKDIGVAVAGNLYTYLDKVNVCLWLKKSLLMLCCAFLMYKSDVTSFWEFNLAWK